jgi:hypothetical protein
MRRFANGLIVLAGLGFLGYDIAFWVAPEATLAGAGLRLLGAGARVETRAFHGGLEVGLGLWLLIAGVRDTLLRPALWLTLASNGGIGCSRLLGLALGGTWIPFFGDALAWELGFAALATAAQWRLRSR